jgi:hypothetical protein
MGLSGERTVCWSVAGSREDVEAARHPGLALRWNRVKSMPGALREKERTASEWLGAHQRGLPRAW